MVVRDAARATLAADTARVWQVRFGGGRDDVFSREEGVTEFARRRTRTTVEYTMSPRVEEALQRMTDRWPWLDDDAPSPGPPELLYAGTASWFIAGEMVSRQADGSPYDLRRTHVDPTWILEVIEHAGREERRSVDQYGFACDLLETGTAIAPPPHPWRRPPRIVGEVWLDASGRIRRTTWRRVDRMRRRGFAPAPVQWTTTDLWDFGVPVELDLPPPTRRPPLPVLAVDLAWRLWRRKRAYERGA